MKDPNDAASDALLEAARDALITTHPDHADDIDRGIEAAARVFSDDMSDFADFCLAQYVPPGEARVEIAKKLDAYLGSLFGNTSVIRKETRHGMDVNEGPLTGVDRLFAAYSPGAHIQEDLRSSGIAAAIQLNFGGDDDDPEDLTERTAEEWLALNLARVGQELVPASLRQQHARAQSVAEELVQSYNLHLGNIDFGDPEVQFPTDVRLISHWGLRDYMTNLTGSEDPSTVKKQRAILGLMERVVTGQIPEDVLDSDDVRWDLAGGRIHTNGSAKEAAGEGFRRWRPFHEVFQIQREIDKHTRRPNLIDTMFLEHRRMKEERVEQMLTQVLSSPLIGRIARYVETRIARPLEPFDIYFKRFQAESLDTDRLDGIVKERYPTRAALQADLPRILERVGFASGEAEAIASHIRIDNGRSAGHAWPPGTPTDQQLLRMRIGEDGVVWQEFGTFMHELGHCVEGVLSSYAMPYRLLWGVPNTAFSEAFAFTFQDLASEMLDVAVERDRDVEMIQRVWEAFEIAGPALVEMRLFRWLYENPDATAADIHQAALRIGDDLWSEFHAPVFGERSYGLMSVYSHMLWGDFYLAEYPVGYIIAYQVRRYLQGRDLAAEMNHMCRLGDIFPDAWMMAAVGERVRVEPMLEDAERALERMGL